MTRDQVKRFALLGTPRGDWPRICRQCVPAVHFSTRPEMVDHMASAHGIAWPAQPTDELATLVSGDAVQLGRQAQSKATDEARTRLAIDTAFARVDQARATLIAQAAAFGYELHKVGRSHLCGLQRAAVQQLSRCCSLEYDLLGGTDITCGLAEALDLQEALDAFEDEQDAAELVGNPPEGEG